MGRHTRTLQIQESRIVSLTVPIPVFLLDLEKRLFYISVAEWSCDGTEAEALVCTFCSCEGLGELPHLRIFFRSTTSNHRIT